MKENSLYKFAQKKFYPVGGVHAVENWCYVRKIVRAVLNGEDIPPYVLCFTGTHRAAANHLLEALGKQERIETVDLENLTKQQNEFFGFLINGDEYYLADLYISRITGYDAYKSALDNTMRSEGKNGEITKDFAGHVASECLTDLDDALKTFLQASGDISEGEILKTAII